MNPTNSKVLIGVSGGVDSLVAAAILVERGYSVEGLYIINGFPDRGESEAEAAAARLKIPLHKIDLTGKFKREVVDYFVAEYMDGRTPNPCIVCNKKIKFACLLKKAEEWGFDYIATGHYARIEHDARENKFKLLKGVDRGKDQSYFLFLLGQGELAKILFPNGDRTKEEIRMTASKMGLESLAEKESQEICFIPDNDYRKFIRENIEAVSPLSGNIVDRKGNILGKHSGIPSYTIGQRRGLNISSTHPYYVLEINKARNEVIIGRENELDFHGLTARDVCWISPDYPDRQEIEATVQIRYRHRGADSIITPLLQDKKALVRFIKPEKAVAPGQAAVFYRGEQLLGGGWIEKGK
ncbi:MAG: tRNA 2-thiouridine(34) synthase MnmA [Proteobacteria bacterium]|nr:tRNA 2-thiouridine(34) synthase MnmA [Pseudomonadota bacterium]